MVWILKYFDHSNGESDYTTWDTKAGAYTQAVAEILMFINDNWDLDDPDIELVAKNINDYALTSDYPKVLELFINEQGEQGSGIYWEVEESKVHYETEADPIVYLLFNDLDDEEEENQEDEDDEEIPFQATESGATCRGPCGSYNEYAYADRADGTHLCHQCKTLNQIFGN